MLLSVAHDFLPKHASVRASQVMDHFGISFEQGKHIIATDLELPLEPGQVVLFTGASGSGKSSLMRAASAALAAGCSSSASDEGPSEKGTRSEGEKEIMAAAPPSESMSTLPSSPLPLVPSSAPATPDAPPTTLSLDDLTLPHTLLIDSLHLPAAEAMNLLSTCGLGEAHLMLRTPAELSDGQRYRFRLALALAQRPQWIVADEFTATLDRTLAKVIAFNIRRIADRTGTGFLLATTHEDVAEDLDPDLHVRCRLDGEVRVERRVGEAVSESSANSESKRGRGEEAKRSPTSRASNPDIPSSPHPLFPSSPSTPFPPAAPPRSRKKKDRSHSPTTSGSPRRPDSTGRTSLGGITAATISASPAN